MLAQTLPHPRWDRVPASAGIPYKPAAAAPILRSALSMLCSQLPSWMYLLLLALSILSEGAGINGHATTEQQADFNVPGELLKLIETN